MEELLNKLIEKGWKPFGDYDIADFNQIWNTFVAINYESKVIGQPKLRQIVSKESWLWQFVCENGMVKKTPTRWEYFNSDTGKIYGFYDDNSTYRLIESALCDEDKLEDFILDNIQRWN